MAKKGNQLKAWGTDYTLFLILSSLLTCKEKDFKPITNFLSKVSLQALFSYETLHHIKRQDVFGKIYMKNRRKMMTGKRYYNNQLTT